MHIPLARSAAPLVGAVLLLGGASGLVSCGDVLTRPIVGEAADASTTDGGLLADVDLRDVNPGADVSAADAPASDGAGSCQNSPAIPLPGGSRCTGDLARRFRFAACACGHFSVSGELATDSFDSTADAGSGLVASVAANGSFSASTTTQVGGSVWAGGMGGDTPVVALEGSGSIASDVRSAGDLEVGGTFRVGGDVYASNVAVDDVASGQSLSISGALHVPDMGVVSAGVTADGGVVRGPLTVGLPCDCSNALDGNFVSSVVAAFKAKNDDAILPLDPEALRNPSSVVTLSCGTYYVTEITGGSVVLQVAGRVALAVDGAIDGALIIDLEPEAELDLFVSGGVTITNGAALGNTAAPGRVRMYVGGPLDLSAAGSVGANIYSTAAGSTQISSAVQMSGALFIAQDLELSGDFMVHYDEAVLRTAGCTPAGGPCTTCDDCASSTPACVGGTCTRCKTDGDCCAPLVCNAGDCVQLGDPATP